MTYTVVAAGRPFMDTVAKVDAGFCDRFDIPANASRFVKRHELQAAKAHLVNPKICVGGPGLNTVATLAALGKKAGYFGKFYADYGDIFLYDFEQREIDCLGLPLYKGIGQSAECLVLESGNSRGFLVHTGCADEFTHGDFQGFNFRTTRYFLVESDLIASPVSHSLIQTVIRNASPDCKIVVNLQGNQSWESCVDHALFIPTYANIIIGNEDEQPAFQAMFKKDELWGKLIVTTIGERGSEARYRGEKIFVPAVEAKNLNDTTGAGDGYLAGLLSGLAEHRPLVESMNLAAQTATAIIEEESGRPLDKRPGAWAHLLRATK